MKKLIAKGKDIDGKTHEFNCLRGTLYCGDNQLTELKIPVGVKVVYCWNNQLTELNLPEGVKEVSCYSNKIAYLNLPDSVIYLRCDKEVTGMEKHVGKVEMRLV